MILHHLEVTVTIAMISRIIWKEICGQWRRLKKIWRTWLVQGCGILARARRVGACSLSQAKLRCEAIPEQIHTQPPPVPPPIIPTMAPANSMKIQEAKKVAVAEPSKAEAIYKEIISKPPSVTSDAAVREYETALVSLGEVFRDERWDLRLL